MRTPVTCPRCQTPFSADVFQLIDVGQQPELKSVFMSGQLNVASCPTCQTQFPVVTPLVYHDPAHELFMVHVPVELNMPHDQREMMIGRMVQQVMNALPQEERKAYLFTPEQVLTLQTFMEKVLATEGITPEMLQRQREQAELLRTLSQADRDVRNTLLSEKAELIDEAFFSMLANGLSGAIQAEDNGVAVKLTNVQAQLYRETKVGKTLERRQLALRAFQSETQKDGMAPAVLLKHIIINQDDDALVERLVMLGQQVLSYEFFQLLTAEVEKKAKLGGDTAAAKLVEIRERLLNLFDEMQRQSQEMMEKAGATLQKLMTATDLQAAVRDNMSEIDDPFMYVLSANIQELEKRGQTDQSNMLRQLHTMILAEMERQAPPEVRFVNQLIRARESEQQRKLLTENPGMVTPELVQMLQSVAGEAAAANQPELIEHIAGIVEIINELGGKGQQTPSIVTP